MSGVWSVLHDGWRRVAVGDVCQQHRQIVPPGSASARGLLFLGLEHVEADSGRILMGSAPQDQTASASAAFLFDERHVLYGKLRPYLNKVALPTFRGRCSTQIIPPLPRV